MVRIVEAIGRWRSGALSCIEASEVLGMSERHFRRLRDRYEAEGAEGLIDRRRGRVSGRRVPVDRSEWVLEQFRTRYFDFTVKHFHERLVAEHRFELGYTWTKQVLQNAGLVRRAPKRSAQRKKRPRRLLPGMLLFQDGSSHPWLDGQPALDLIVTMDDANNEVYSAFLVAQEGTDSSFRGLAEVIERHGLFCSFYTDRGSHYFVTPKANGKVAKEQLTQVGRALAQLGIEHIPAYSPEARGRMERVFGTLQKRLPQELRLAGITTIEGANRFLAERFVPAHNARFAVAAAEAGSAFVAFAGISPRFCACRSSGSSATTTACATAACACRSRRSVIATTSSRSRCACTPTGTAGSPSSTARAAWPATRPAAVSSRRRSRPKMPPEPARRRA